MRSGTAGKGPGEVARAEVQGPWCRLQGVVFRVEDRTDLNSVGRSADPRDLRVISCLLSAVGGGVRIHPENARMNGRHGVQYVAQCVACAALTPVVWQ